MARRAAIPWLLLSTATANLMFPMFFLGELIVFPDEALPLQIFEPRYRLLVARCLGDLEAAADLAVLSPFVGDADPCKFGILFERLGRGARGVLATIDRASIETAEEPVAYKLVATGTERFAKRRRATGTNKNTRAVLQECHSADKRGRTSARGWHHG